VFDLVQESLRFFRQQSDHFNMALALGILGDIELAREDSEQAKLFYQEALLFYMETGNKKTAARHLIRQAKLCKKRGDIEGVTYILNAAEVWQNPLPPALWNEYDKMVEWLQTQIGEADLKESLSQERAMTLQQLLALLKTGVATE
jgi:hypothetical protein